MTAAVLTIALLVCYSTPPQVIPTCNPALVNCEKVGQFTVCDQSSGANGREGHSAQRV